MGLFLFPLASLAHNIPSATPCHGYRYAYMTTADPSHGDKVDLFACKEVLQPSSIPVGCERIGQIDTQKITDTTYLVGKKILSYKSGIIAGATCVVMAQIGSFFNEPVSIGTRAYNFGAATSEIEALKEETRSGKRELGTLPLADSKRSRAVSGFCSTVVGGKKTEFQNGAQLSIETFLSLNHRIMGLQADSREVWTSSSSDREAKFKEFKKNVNRTRALEYKAASGSLSALKIVYDYFTSNEIVNVPFGLTSDLAVVPTDSCIPFPDVDKLKQYIGELNLVTQQAKVLLEDKDVKNIAQELAAPQIEQLGYHLGAKDAEILGFAPGASPATLDNDSCVANLYKTKIFNMIEKQEETCPDTPKVENPVGETNADNLKSLSAAFSLQGEAKFYSLAASKHSEDLTCAKKILPNLTKTPEMKKSLLSLFQRLRKIKSDIAAASLKIASNPAIMTKTCPVRFEDLLEEKSRNSEDYFENCRRIIQGRTAYLAIQNTIPLSNTETIREFTRKFMNFPDAEAEKNLASGLDAAYEKSALELGKASAHLDLLAASEEGLANRNAQIALLSDPLLTSLAIHGAENFDEVQATACKANMDFSKTGGYFDPTPYVGSLFADGRSSLHQNMNPKVTEISDAALGARMTGAISTRAVKAIQLAASTSENLGSFAKIGESCPLAEEAGCSAVPTQKRLEQDICVLNASLSAMGYSP